MLHLPFSSIHAAGIFGNISNPTAYISPQGEGLFSLISNLFKLSATVGGLLVVFQLISAGYMYISAEGDPKKFEQAWSKIWQALLGMIIIASAFTIAAVIGLITKVNVLNPEIYGP